MVTNNVWSHALQSMASLRIQQWSNQAWIPVEGFVFAPCQDRNPQRSGVSRIKHDLSLDRTFTNCQVKHNLKLICGRGALVFHGAPPPLGEWGCDSPQMAVFGRHYKATLETHRMESQRKWTKCVAQLGQQVRREEQLLERPWGRQIWLPQQSKGLLPVNMSTGILRTTVSDQ